MSNQPYVDLIAEGLRNGDLAQDATVKINVYGGDNTNIGSRRYWNDVKGPLLKQLIAMSQSDFEALVDEGYLYQVSSDLYALNEEMFNSQGEG